MKNMGQIIVTENDCVRVSDVQFKPGEKHQCISTLLMVYVSMMGNLS
jgi:hypothetical protein